MGTIVAIAGAVGAVAGLISLFVRWFTSAPRRRKTYLERLEKARRRSREQVYKKMTAAERRAFMRRELKK